MSKNKYAQGSRIALDEARGSYVERKDEPPRPKPASEIEATAVLSYARGKDGRIAIMLEVDGKVTRGGPELKSKRDATITLYRAVADLKRVVDAPVGRGKR